MPEGRDGRGRNSKEGDHHVRRQHHGEQIPEPYRVPGPRPRGKKGFWTRIGSAWAHADGSGFNIQLECIPLDGRITLRVASEKKE
ncbi:MAG: hypothetical protein R3B90_00125 [Planctomycetaceae bacterium]